MKRQIYLFGLILSTSLIVACKQNDDEPSEQPQEVEVAFNMAVGYSSSGFTKDANSTYDRNAAPVYVSGVIITAAFQKSDYAPALDVTEEFPFETPDEPNLSNPIIMDVRVGENDFTAVGTATYPAGIWQEQYFMAKDNTTNDLNVKAGIYGAALLDATNTNAHPIYVEYATDEPAKRIVSFNTDYFDNLVANGKPIYGIDPGLTLEELLTVDDRLWDNGYFEAWAGYVDLSLTPQTGRTSVVFETTKDLYFKITAVLWGINPNTDALEEIDTQILTHGNGNTTDISAIIFNDANMVEGSQVVVNLKKSSDNQNWEVFSDITIPTQAGVNTTHLIYFNGSDTNDIGVNASYILFSDDYDQHKEITN